MYKELGFARGCVIMKIAIDPYVNKGNEYIEIIKRACAISNIETCSITSSVKSISKFINTRIYFFNWYENIGKNRYTAPIKFLIKISFILLLKIFRKKIVWTMHNKRPHNTKTSLYISLIMHFMIKVSDRIIILSNETRYIISSLMKSDKYINKTFLVPHPNYIDSLNLINTDKSNGIKTFLFFGRVQPYKNIELILSIARDIPCDKARFIIAGNPISQKYKNEIIEKAKNSNVQLKLYFIENNEIVELMHNSDCVILPLDMTSSLNSGSVYFAFSNKCTVICPLIGTIKDIENDNMYFTYSYTTINEHRLALKNAIEKVIETDSDVLLQMGQRAFDYVKQNNSIEIIADRIKMLVSSLS